MLIAQASKSLLIAAVKSCRFIGSIPYNWDKNSQKFTYDDSLKLKVIWWAHNLVYNSYMLFVLIRYLMAIIHTGNSNSSTALGTLYVLISYQCANAVQLSLLYSYGQHHKWLNMFFEYMEEMQKTERSEGTKIHGAKKQGDCTSILWIFWISVHVIFCLDTWSVFGTPHSYFFYTSITADPPSMTFWDIIPYAAFHDYIWIYQWLTMLFYYCSMICYFTGTTNTLELLRCTVSFSMMQQMNQIKQLKSRRASRITLMDHEVTNDLDNISIMRELQEEEAELTEKLAHVEEELEEFMKPIGENTKDFAKAFRKLEILQCQCNKIWSSCNAFYEVSFIGGSVLGFYGAVRLERARAAQQLVVALFITYTLMVIWQQMGSIYEQSKDILHSWIVMKTNGWFRRFHISARPVRINIGNFFYADRGIRLTILAIIFERTSSLLLSS